VTAPAAAPTAWREPAADALDWAMLFGINSLGILPWFHVAFPTVDLAAIVFDVGRLRAGYVPYRDTFNHHFVRAQVRSPANADTGDHARRRTSLHPLHAAALGADGVSNRDSFTSRSL
jgi:hypothetical protein